MGGLIVDLVVLFGPLLVLLAIAGALTVRVTRVIRASVLMFRGEYARAEKIWRKLATSWMPTLAPTAKYNVAFCLHHQGDLEGSLATLRALETTSVRGVLAKLIDGLIGGNLALLQRDATEAATRLERFQAFYPLRANLLNRAHVALDAGDEPGAREWFRQALDSGQGARWKVDARAQARLDRVLQTAVDSYLIGWFFLRQSDPEQARPHLLTAGASPRHTVYAQRARDALGKLPPVAASDEEVPSSLDPVELSKSPG